MSQHNDTSEKPALAETRKLRVMFSVSYEIVSQESAESGESEETGMIDDALFLREAVEALFQTRTNHVGGISCIEPSDSHCPRWITVSNGMEFRTGDYESRSLHFPKRLTIATRRRIVRLVKGDAK
jgi:hypothetical protein